MSLLERYFSKTPETKQNKAAIAYLAALDYIAASHPEISNCIIQELKDQRSHLKLIASENYSSLAVQLAMGNLLTDKYAEGYAHHRFYAGCENVDTIEEAAIRELKAIFGCEEAYVQPHSGADANMVAFWSILVHRVQNPAIEKLGKKNLDELTADEYETVRQLMLNQKVMGMSLNSGGHLTHGYRHNISSKMMRSVLYDVDRETGLLDYKALAEMAQKEQPDILLAGYSAYPRKINFAKMREIADSVGAVLMVDMAHFAGLVAGGVFPSPLPHAHVVTTTTHKTLRGPRGGMILSNDLAIGKKLNSAIFPGAQGGPLMHIIAAKAVAFKEALSPAFKQYAEQVVKNAKTLVKALNDQGFNITTQGTDCHLLLVDLQQQKLTGQEACDALEHAGITCNKNGIPFDPLPPLKTSGIRLGSPALTTRGMKEAEFETIGFMIAELLKSLQQGDIETTQPKIRQKVAKLCQSFPLYKDF